MEGVEVLQQIGDPQLGTEGPAPAQVSWESNTVRHDTHSNDNLYTHKRTDPESELVAPAIVIGPKDTTVVAGNEATLECIA
ncbi:protein sidekick-1 isoform X1 [Lates japonicus]|uniref:Protein sidekick-1 isoform X1 n=1 Tax=Lates japonicus TaxID=270547 RepID=A0AAD3R1S8_LATJO|nr:protein sidekick-1 isoform X1 [Lates japonicus]